MQVPDVRSRVAAIELLLREGLGRPPQAEEAASPRLPRTAEFGRYGLFSSASSPIKAHRGHSAKLSTWASRCA